MKRIAGHVVRHHVESGHQITRVVGGKLALTPAYVRNNFFFADVTAQLAPRVRSSPRIELTTTMVRAVASPIQLAHRDFSFRHTRIPINRPKRGSPSGFTDGWIGMSATSTTTTTKARSWDHDRRTITRICLIPRYEYTSVARSSKALIQRSSL